MSNCKAAASSLCLLWLIIAAATTSLATATTTTGVKEENTEPRRRVLPKGELTDELVPLAGQRNLMMMMMMKKKKKKKKQKDDEANLFIGEDAKTDYTYYGGVEFYKGKGKNKSGGMMKKKKSKKSKGKGGKGKGKGKGGSSSKSYKKYYDDNYYYHPVVPPPTNGAPPVTAQFVQTLGCYSEMGCIYSHNPDFSTEYLLEDSCSWTVTDNGVLMVEYFDLEDGFDFLTVAGVGFTGNGEGLDGYPVFPGDELLFESDFLNPSTGFKVCLSNPV